MLCLVGRAMGVPCVGVQRLQQFALWELQKAFQGNTSELHHLEGREGPSVKMLWKEDIPEGESLCQGREA